MVDREIAAIFARQYGLITRSQALAAGASDRMVHSRTCCGRWVRVAGGVYRLAGVEVTWHQRALAACLSAGPQAVVSHRSAAVLLKVSGFRPGPLDITVPPGRSNRNPLATVHRAALGPGDRTVRDRMPATSAGRTLADLSRQVPHDVLEEAVDDVLCRRLTTLAKLQGRGGKALDQVLQAWTPGALPGSVAEMGLVRALLAAGLPPPHRQHWIPAAHARIDLAYPEARVAIELSRSAGTAVPGPSAATGPEATGSWLPGGSC